MVKSAKFKAADPRDILAAQEQEKVRKAEELKQKEEEQKTREEHQKELLRKFLSKFPPKRVVNNHDILEEEKK